LLSSGREIAANGRESDMFRSLITAVLGVLLAAPAFAQVQPFPTSFVERDIATNGATIHIRVGGAGPAIVLLHGYGETGDMWAPLAANLARDHTVVVPDLRGMGLSSKPAGGYDKKTQGRDISGVLDTLQIGKTDLVTHDIGNMVGYAFAAENRDRVTRFVLMDAPLPGIGPWEEILKNPLLWHFRFGGPDMERLVAGRERIYLDRFWNEFSATPAKFSEASREHYAALYAQPGAMHAGFAQFAAFDQDAIDNQAFLAAGKLTMPVLAVGGGKSFGPAMAAVMRFAATNVTEAVIPDAGHWLMEEQPVATVKVVRDFLDGVTPASAPVTVDNGERRLTPTEVLALPVVDAGAGTSGLKTIETRVLFGDPAKPGPYTIAIHVPPNTKIAAHTHRDNRSAVVVSGVWRFGYGAAADDAATRELTVGGFYTEPAADPHFAATGAEGATVYISGIGPSDTRYTAEAAKP
jgi:pimeloyl-ACP methyl ester carboxylesterase